VVETDLHLDGRHGDLSLSRFRTLSPGSVGVLTGEREPFYRRADVLVNTELRSVKEVVHHVIHQYRLARGRPSHSSHASNSSGPSHPSRP